MSTSRNDSFVLVEAAPRLEDAVRELEGSLEKQERHPAALFLDTEFESNRAGTRLCLLQISAGHTAYLVDTVQLKDLSPLTSLLQRDGVEWVLHAGTQDVALLMDRLQLGPPPALFDTQLAWGLLGPEPSVSLAYLQYRLLGLRSTKTHQADDWLRRPLPEAQLKYAADDVLYLPAMAEELRLRAERKDRLRIVRDASLDALHPSKEPPPPLRLAAFRNAWQLREKNQAALRYLIEWYNELSPEERKHAPENKTLLALASRLPEDVGAMGRIKGVSRSVIKRHGRQLVAGLKAAVARARKEDFVPIDPAPYATFEEIRLEAWLARLRAEVCATLECAPELVLPGRLTRSMQNTMLSSGAEGLFQPLVGWKKELLEPAMRRFCQEHPPPLVHGHAEQDAREKG